MQVVLVVVVDLQLLLVGLPLELELAAGPTLQAPLALRVMQMLLQQEQGRVQEIMHKGQVQL
jgi:hypothetical protein